MAMPLQGGALAQKIRETVKTRVAALKALPKLAVLLVGEDPASHLYVSLKEEACGEVGIQFEKFLFPAETKEEVLLAKIGALNADAKVNGILVQLPLPSQDADKIIAAIDPNKDVDGFHPENLARLREGKPTIVSALALGILKLIDHAMTKYEPKTVKTCVVLGSKHLAEPIGILLKERGIKTSRIEPTEAECKEKMRDADILVVAVGKPGFVDGSCMKPGAIVIDVGTTKVDGKLMGDVDADAAKKIAGALTPVPGGVGPMTVAMLLVNVLKAADLQRTKTV